MSIVYCNYNDVNEVIKEFYLTREYQEYDAILITDISVSEEVAEIIESHKTVIEVKLLDHHQTAEWLNKYDWAKVQEKILSDNTSGTELLYLFLFDSMSFNGHLFEFVKLVTLYDTWRWQHDFDEPYMPPKQLNDLYYLLGRDEFIKQMLDGKYVSDFDLLIKANTDRINRLVEKKKNQMKLTELDDYKFGFVFSEECLSEIGNELSKANPELSFIAVIDMSNQTVSLRTTRKDINLGIDVAKQFGGGGHIQSAGCPMTAWWQVLVKKYMKGDL